MDWSTFIKPSIQPVAPYQPGMRPEQVAEIVKGREIYKLSSNESPLEPFASSLTAMRESLVTLNEYCDGSCHDLKQKLSQHYGIDAAEIIVGNGTNELLDLIAEVCLEPGDNVVYGWPSFVVYQSSAQIAGATFTEVALRDDGVFDLDALLAAVTEKTKIIYITSPNNPTGGIVSQQEFDDFMQQVPGHVLVVVDNAYQEFVMPGEDAFDPFSHYDGTRPLVILRTFSKMYALAGARVGYGFAPGGLVEAIDKVREPFNVNSIAQAGAAACLDDIEELNRRRQLNFDQRQRLYQAFERLGLRYYPSAANFVWVYVPDAATSFNELLERGVIVRPFPPSGGLRVGVGTEAATDATIAAFNELFGK
jgi:histidinol-phosphate aminotransferase